MHEAIDAPADRISPPLLPGVVLVEDSPGLVPDTVRAMTEYAQTLHTLPEEAKRQALAGLREQRLQTEKVGYEHVPTSEAQAVDSLVVELVRQGDMATASQLVTPNISEHSRLSGALWRTNELAHANDPVQTALEAVILQRGQQFTEQIKQRAHSLGEEGAALLASELRVHNIDPESALAVPESFWNKFAGYAPDIQDEFLESKLPLPQLAQALEFLEQRNLLGHATKLAETLAQAGSPEQQKAYVESYERLITSFPDLGPRALETLAKARDPEATHIQLTKQLPDTSRETSAGILSSLLLAEDPKTRTVPFELTKAVQDSVQAYTTLSKIGVQLYLPQEFFRGYNTVEKQPGGSAALEQAIEAVSSLEILGEDSYYARDEKDRGLTAKRVAEELEDMLTRSTETLSVAQVERFALRAKATRQFFKVSRKNDFILRDDITAEIDRRDTSEGGNCSLVGDVYRSLQLPAEMEKEVIDSMRAFDALERSRLGLELEDYEKVPDDSLLDGLRMNAKVLYKQLSSLQEYAAKYGQEELVTQFHTFGIANFARASAEQFHDQLVRWNEQPGKPPDNINLSTRSEYNDAFGDEAEIFFQYFSTGEEEEANNFFFEVSDDVDAARRIVQIGDRERANGRNPEQDNTIKNVIISGHGAPESVQFSRKGFMNAAQFAQAKEGRESLNRISKREITKPNDYSRHLGSNFRVIFHACSADGKSKLAFNISQAVASELGRAIPVVAAGFNTAGYAVDSAGEVTFKRAQR